MPLRLVFMGTPGFAIPTLRRIAADGHEIAAVYTRPPRSAGRGMADQPSPTHLAARDMGLPLVMPKTLRIAAAETLFAGHQADVAVVVAYGLILPPPILAAPRLGCLNLHASLLPRWRGAAPIQRALMAGDRETGVMVMRMAEGLDTGPICLEERTAIAPDETAGQLHDRLAAIGAELMAGALAKLADGALACAPQDEAGATYAAKIDKAETRIDWSRPAQDVLNHLRGLSPWPGAWCEMPIGSRHERVKILRARLADETGDPGALLALDPLVVACGSGAIALTELQRAGKRPAPSAAFLSGARLSPGARLR